MAQFIYKTVNLLNGKIYIGQHTTENIDDGYLGSGVILQKAFKKYGKENFKREVLKMVDGSKEDLDHTEEFYIKHYRDKIGWGMMYNATECAFGGAPYTEETRKKMSEIMKGRPNGWEGRHHTEETKKKTSEALKGNQHFKGHHHSEETKQKLSEKNKGRQFTEETKLKISATQKNHPNKSKPVLCVETNTIYSSVKEAGRQTGISPGNISSVCRKKTKTAGRYHWKYIEE